MADTSKSKALNKKREPKEEYFGLPHGAKDTPQLRKRFKNYVKKNEKHFGPGDKADNYRLQRMNSYYDFDKPEHDK